MKNTKKVLFVLSAVAMVSGLASCKKNKEANDGYTYRTYSTALASNWNPHTWETNADDSVLSYLSEGLVSLTVKDSVNGVYQWCYDQAESIKDVTFDHLDDLVKYCGLTEAEATSYAEGAHSLEMDGQYVYEVKLRDGLKWQDGTPINADSFIESGKRLLDPAMLNYRANLYVSGESALAGAKSYYYQGHAVFLDNNTEEIYESINELELVDGVYCLKGTELRVQVSLCDVSSTCDMSYLDLYENGYISEEGFMKVAEISDDDGYFLLTEETLPVWKEFVTTELSPLFGGLTEDDFVYFTFVEQIFPESDWGDVGLYKVDDRTFRYVMATPLDWSQAMVSFTSSWLVHENTYDSLKKVEDGLTTTTYGTDVASSMSYGPYKLTSLQASKQMVFEKNENWWGWEKDENGKLVSYTQFEVDGKHVQQYQATKIVIDVLDDAAAKQKFLSGELTEYAPTASELKDYTLSDALYQVPETYTMSFFFNTNLNVLKTLDTTGGNKNSVVLSNKNFRKAMSLAINRAEFVTATPAYTPNYSLMNDLYFYDVWNDPESSYRHSDPAMQAICDLYGVEYGEGKPYATLEEAYASINGYNLTEAKSLMVTAFNELKAEGLVTDGAEVKIKIGWSKGALSSDDQAQIALLNKYFAAVIEGSGFSKFEVEAVGNIEDRYGAVPRGEYAIGYGAWGGAAFYPFRNLQVYADPDSYDVNELGCWNPTTERYKVTVDGEEYDLTWQQWSNVFVDQSICPELYAASNEVKLQITAELEKAYLEFFYRIPLCGTTSAFLLGYQVSYYTENYNIMYDFGGFRLMSFNYNDAEWADFVASQGGIINYR